MRRSRSTLLSLSNLFATSFSALILFLLIASFLSPSSAFAQGSKRKSLYDPIEEKDKDRPDKRAEWMMRGRVAPKGQSAAALRLRAVQQKMAARAAREAAAAKTARSMTAAPATAGWVFLGPAPLVSDQNFYGTVSGRSTAIAVDPSDATGNTVYAAGASGGVWKSTNAADATATSVTWTPVTDQQASLTNGAVSVKSDGSVVLVGTGEPDNAINSYYGVGILRSTNRGRSCTLISADSGARPFAGMGFSKFAWSTASGATSTVVAAGADAFKGDQEDLSGSTLGIYLSTDAGQTWAYQKPTDNSASASATDVVYNASAAKFFTAIRFHGVYSSANGTSWTRLTNQPNPTQLSLTNCPTAATSACPMYRGQFTVVPGRNEMYFWFIDDNDQDQGIWQSLDGGNTWKQVQASSQCNLDPDANNPPCGMLQPFYNLELGAIPNGSNTDLYAGLVNLYKCRVNSGTQSCATIDANQPNAWINLTQVYTCSQISLVHPDEHGFGFEIVGGKAITYFGNDGGVYRTLDALTQLQSGTCGTPNTFENLNATIGSMTQFVSFSVHPTDQNTVMGGTQDNGSPATNQATTNPQFITILGGDGGYNAINPNNTDEWFASNPGSEIGICESGIGCNDGNFFYEASPDVIGNIDYGAFYTPLILDPQDSGVMLIGTCHVWRGTTNPPEGPGTFTSLSVNFDTLDATACNGGEINQVHDLAAGGAKDANGLSNVIYAVTFGLGPLYELGTGGEVWATTNAFTTQLSNVTGSINPNNYAISAVAIDNADATGKTAYVGIMGFNTSHVFKTTTAGTGAWTDWSGSGATALPDSPVNDLLVDSQKGQIYAATDVGIFVSSTSSASWTEVGPAPGSGAGYLPNVPVSAIRMFNNGTVKALEVSTYGRGIWEFPLAAAPDFTNVISNSPQTIFPAQTATFSGTLTATGGYNSPVNLTCTGTPPTTCTPSPTPVTPTTGGAAYTVTAGGAIGDYNFNAHAVGTDAGTTTHDAAIALHVVDFELTSVSPSPVTAPQGFSGTGTFMVTASGSFAQTVTLSCPSGLPAQATCAFSPSSTVSPTAGNPVPVTMTVSTTGSTPQGTTNVTLQGATSGPAATRSEAFHFTVGPPPDFTFVINGSNTHTVLAGQTTQAYSFTVTAAGGATTFAGQVAFTCPTGLPPDGTAACSNPTITAGTPSPQTVTMTISTKGPNSGTGPSIQRRADKRAPWLPLAVPLAGIVMLGIAGRKASRRSAIAFLCISLVLLGFMLACGSSSSSPPPPVGITVSPNTKVNLYFDEAGNSWLAAATQQQYTANVTNSTNTAVSWEVNGVASGNTTFGTITSAGLYTAPATLPSPATFNVTAVAQADTTKTANDQVNILTPTATGTFTPTVTVTEGVSQHSLPAPGITLIVQ